MSRSACEVCGETYDYCGQCGTCHKCMGEDIDRLKAELEEAQELVARYDDIKDDLQMDKAELQNQLAEARAELQFYKEAQAYSENQYLLAIQETNLLRGNIKEANSQIDALADCLNGSRKATYTAEMYDKAISEARQEAAREIRDFILTDALGENWIARWIEETFKLEW